MRHRTFIRTVRLWAPRWVIVRAALQPERWLDGGPIEVVRSAGVAGGGLGVSHRASVRLHGYRLTWTMTVVRVTPSLIRWRAEGDLRGEAVWHLTGDPASTVVESVWRVAPTRAWMRVGWPLFARVFVGNHDRIMRIGTERLRAVVEEDRSDQEPDGRSGRTLAASPTHS